MSGKLKFFKCFGCSKNFKHDVLTDLMTSSVEIDGEQINYCDLVLDVCLFQLEPTKPNKICEDCSNNLISFHFFKRAAKNYDNFQNHLQKLQILAKVEDFLEKVDDIEKLVVAQEKDSFTISTFFETENEFLNPETLENQTENENLPYEEGEVFGYEEVPVENEEIPTENEEITPQESQNISSNPTTEQIEWIQKEVSSSQTKTGSKISFRCSICLIFLSSPASLTRHLREIHVQLENNAENSLNREQREELLTEVKNSKINILTLNGAKATWRCQKCEEKRVFKSEIAFKSHFRTSHLPRQFEVFEISENLPVGEICENPEEFLVATESIEEIHEEVPQSPPAAKKRKLNTLDDLTADQISWIRENVAIGEIMQGKKKVFKCSVCQCVLATQASLTRHLRDIHILKDQNDERSTVKSEVNNARLEVNGEIVFKCRMCEVDRVYKSEQAFKLHMRMNHIRTTKVDTSFVAACKTKILENGKNRDAWWCPDCSRIFKHRDTLRNHVKIEHPNINESEAKEKMKKVQPQVSDDAKLKIAERLEQKELGKSQSFCNECGLKFPGKHHVKLKIHKECHETFKILSPNFHHFKCESCRIIFNSDEILAQHLMIHGNSKDVQEIPADGLAKLGASVYKAPIGDADDAVDEAVWKCGHCPKNSVQFFDENDCMTHIMLLHCSQLQCFVDNRTFDGSSGMSKFLHHMKNKHPELFPDVKYPCGSCEEEFPTIYEKLAHEKVCGNKKFECDYCGKRYKAKYILQSHILYELGLSGYSCEFCGKRCKGYSDLKIHLNVHSKSRPYPCSLCPKTFKTPGARSDHLETHTSEKLECEICGQKLANRALYVRHKRFQHNREFRELQLEKNQCTLCCKSFLRSFQFVAHMKSVHGIQQA